MLAAVAAAAVCRLGHAVMRSLYAPASVVQPFVVGFLVQHIGEFTGPVAVTAEGVQQLRCFGLAFGKRKRLVMQPRYARYSHNRYYSLLQLGMPGL